MYLYRVADHKEMKGWRNDHKRGYETSRRASPILIEQDNPSHCQHFPSVCTQRNSQQRAMLRRSAPPVRRIVHVSRASSSARPAVVTRGRQMATNYAKKMMKEVERDKSPDKVRNNFLCRVMMMGCDIIREINSCEGE